MIKTIKKFMPRISDTERVALECGTVSIDGDIFAGRAPAVTLASWNDLTSEEAVFLNTKVEELLQLQREMGYTDDNDLHPDVWQFLKDNRFFSMIIPKAHGGLEFTPLAQSLVVSKIASAGHTGLAVTVMVPNSLGPGELLMHYGTTAQKSNYLGPLARGEMIPCFGLTGLHNGSDATTIIDTGEWDPEVNGWRVSLNKRYITLAPVADLIGLAIKVEGAITLFLIERNHPGLEIGERHNPLGQPFMNGTIKGDIVLTVANVLGGKKHIGDGWRMLVECLSVGRAISLPALGTAACAKSALAAGSYSKAREQFGMSIGKIQGIQEPLADLVYQSYLTITTQQLINGELQRGESPSALSAMWKYQATERGRIAVNHAMDIMAGAAIQEGPNNVIANLYKSIPIAITVEGANILSRSLVTFGGGLMRSHPHLKNLVDAIEAEDTGAFLKHLAKMIGHTGSNFSKAIFRNKNALFAFTANMVLTLGAKYKRSEYISARMADIFSIRVMEAAVLERVPDSLTDYILKRLHNEEAQAYRDIVAELPLLSGSAVRLAKSTLFHGDKHISTRDIETASFHISNKSFFAQELINYVYLDGRMSELVECYSGDTQKDRVIEVDSE